MIIQTMLRDFPPLPDCYLYGPVCVAETERGKGLAGALFEVLQRHMAGRPAMTFIRADNIASRHPQKRTLELSRERAAPYGCLAGPI